MTAPLRCRLLGHKYPSRSQVWADVEMPEKDGTWLQVRFGCARCSAGALLGSLWLQDGGTTAQVKPQNVAAVCGPFERIRRG